MKICIILDGVLIDKRQFQYRYGLEFFNNKLRFQNEYSYQFKNMFNCSNEEEVKFWNKYLTEYYLNAKPEAGARKCINSLKNDNEIYIIVDRNYLTKKCVKGYIYKLLLKFWFQRNNIQYDGIIYCDKNNLDEKIKICEENKFDLVIEHLIPDIIQLSKTCNVFVYDRPYNQGLSSVDRVYSFYEILNKVEKRGKVKK